MQTDQDGLSRQKLEPVAAKIEGEEAGPRCDRGYVGDRNRDAKHSVPVYDSKPPV